MKIEIIALSDSLVGKTTSRLERKYQVTVKNKGASPLMQSGSQTSRQPRTGIRSHEILQIKGSAEKIARIFEDCSGDHSGE